MGKTLQVFISTIVDIEKGVLCCTKYEGWITIEEGQTRDFE